MHSLVVINNKLVNINLPSDPSPPNERESINITTVNEKFNSEYFAYKKISLRAIKDIYVNENISVIANYIIPPHQAPYKAPKTAFFLRQGHLVVL